MKSFDFHWWFQRTVLFAILMATLISMNACVSIAPVPPAEDADKLWQDRSMFLYQQEHWTAHLTLLGVKDQQKFKTRAQWEQQGESYTIKLRDFIGRTIAVIEGSPQGVKAKTSKGQHYQSESAEKLIQELFDIHIPVSGMRFWLLGVPKPQVQISQLMLNEKGLVENLKQQQWTVEYSSYTHNNAVNVPNQIMLAYSDIDLNVKISQWTFHAE